MMVSSSIDTATITPTSDGLMTLDVNTGVALDDAGNGNNAAPPILQDL